MRVVPNEVSKDISLELFPMFASSFTILSCPSWNEFEAIYSQIFPDWMLYYSVYS